MTNRMGAIWARCGAVSLALAPVACGDDDAAAPLVDGGADARGAGGGGGTGEASTGGGGGGSSVGGRGGGGGVGAGGGGGVAGASQDSGAPDAADGEAGPPSCVSALGAGGGAPDGAVGARLTVATTDFALGATDVTTVDVGTGVVLGTLTFQDFDAVVTESAGRLFVLERTNGVLHEIDATSSIRSTIDLTGDGGAPPNPHAVVVVPGTSKAYVSLYGASAIAVVDLASARVTGSIDLSSLAGASDTDGSVDVDSGVFDPATGRVYFALQRVDLTTVAAETSYRQLCASEPGLLVGIDVATDTLVTFGTGALRGDAGAEAGAAEGGTGAPYVELGLVASQGMVLGEGGLLLVSSGCYDVLGDGGYVLRDHGVEAVDPASGRTTTLLTPPSDNLYTRLWALSSRSLVIGSLDGAFAARYDRYDPSLSVLGAELSGVPEVPSVESPTTLLGVSAGAVVRYDVGAQTTETIVQSPCLWDTGYLAASVVW